MQGAGHGGDGGLVGTEKKVEDLLLGQRGVLPNATHRRKAIELIGEANTAGAGLISDCTEFGICLRMLKHWCKAFAGYAEGDDRRKGSFHLFPHM